jgi:hypothetical protein
MGQEYSQKLFPFHIPFILHGCWWVLVQFDHKWGAFFHKWSLLIILLVWEQPNMGPTFILPLLPKPSLLPHDVCVCVWGELLSEEIFIGRGTLMRKFIYIPELNSNFKHGKVCHHRWLHIRTLCIIAFILNVFISHNSFIL